MTYINNILGIKFKIIFRLILFIHIALINFTTQAVPLSKQVLTHEILKELKNKRTINGVTLDYILKSGKDNPDSSIGIYAGDKESYEVFSQLFDAIVSEYHRIPVTAIRNLENWDISKIPYDTLDKEKKYIISTRIRVARNLSTYPFPSKMSLKERLEVEGVVQNIAIQLNNIYKGSYYSLININDKKQNELVKSHVLFKEGDRFLRSAGITADWPQGRGIYISTDKKFIIWVNEEDHLRIIALEEGSNILSVFKRLKTGLGLISKHLTFAYSDKYGYLTSCPTNLGTTMRASVLIKLPKLSKDFDEFKKICKALNLDVRGIYGEHSTSYNGIYDISNNSRLGLTEVEIINTLSKGILELIKLEKEME